MNEAAIIVCNGNVDDYKYYDKYFNNAKLVICADGAAQHLKRFGLLPDLLIGDFDSILPDDLEFYRSRGVRIEKFPVEKDKTDAELAVDIAMNLGYKKIIIIGGLGTRLDHSLSNVFLLKKMLDNGVCGIIANKKNEIMLINDRITLDREEGAKVSLLPVFENAEGVSTRGLYYPLHDATIPAGSTWGVSNQFVADKAEVTIKKGFLLVIKSWD